MSEISKNFQIFEFFRSSFCHFPTEVCKYSFKSLPDCGFSLCWTLLTFCHQNDSKNTQVAKVRRIFWRIWSHSEVFLKPNAATFSSKKVIFHKLFPCGPFKTFQSTRSVEDFKKSSFNLWKLENFRFPVISGVNLRHCHLGNCNKLFAKAYWALHSFLVNPFQRSNLQSPSIIWKKMHKIFEN